MNLTTKTESNQLQVELKESQKEALEDVLKFIDEDLETWSYMDETVQKARESAMQEIKNHIQEKLKNSQPAQ